MQHSLATDSVWEERHRIKRRLSKSSTNKAIIFIIECVYFSFSQYELFFKILPRYLNNRQEIIEIGSAPGKSLVLMNKLYGSKVFGVEYNASGYEQNRLLFRKNGISSENLFKKDFFKFSPKKLYDVVFSYGFIEHYTEPAEILKKQALLLKKNGLIICVIPNFSNLNYSIQKIIDNDNLKIHNLDIMDINAYEKLFTDYNKLYAGYYGICSFRIFQTKNSLLKAVMILFKPLRIIFNLIGIVISLIFDTSKWPSSPFLIYIGSKK